MSRGHPDYWSGQIPAMPKLAPDQTSWFRSGTTPVAAGGNALIIEYTVPAGYELYITGAIASSDFPIIQRVELLYGEAYITSFCGQIWYNTLLILPVNGWNRVVVDAGTPVAMKFYNDDSAQHNFNGNLVGFLQEKE